MLLHRNERYLLNITMYTSYISKSNIHSQRFSITLLFHSFNYAIAGIADVQPRAMNSLYQTLRVTDPHH